jgi:hypothetical protein
MPYQREAAIVLGMWREVERDLSAAIPESAEAEALQIEAARLRDEYQRLIGLATNQGRPVPPPLPEASERDAV